MDNSCDYSHRPHYKSQIHLYIWKLHVSPHTIHIATQFTSKFLQEGWSQSKGRSAKSASQHANLLCKVRIYCFRVFFLCSGSLCYRYPERPGKKLLLTEGLHQVGRKCNVPRTLGLASKHKLHQGYTTIVLTVLFVDHYSATSFSKKNYLLQRVSLQLFDKTQMKHKVSGKSKL